MKREQEFKILEFYWNRLSYTQKLSLFLQAKFYLLRKSTHLKIRSLLSLCLFIFMVMLPMFDRRRKLARAHYINERRRPVSSRIPTAIVLFSVTTIVSVLFMVHTAPVSSHPQLSAILLFFNVLSNLTFILFTPSLKLRKFSLAIAAQEPEEK